MFRSTGTSNQYEPPCPLKVIKADIKTLEQEIGPFAGCDRMSKNRCTIRLREYDYSQAGIYFVIHLHTESKVHFRGYFER